MAEAKNRRLAFWPTLPGLLLVLALACLNGCARPQQVRPAMDAPPQALSAVWLFRHKVHLDIPKINVAQSFDGMMRLDAAKGSVRAAGLGGLGLRLFDLTVDAQGVQSGYLHPVLARLPGANERIADVIYNIWFDSLTQMQLRKTVQHDNWRVVFSGPLTAGMWPERIVYTDTRVPYTVTIRLLQAAEEQP